MSEDVIPKRRPPGLGRGLAALLGENQAEAPVQAGPDGAVPQGVRLVATAGLRPMPNQPRKNFDDDALDELAESIKARGLLQPIIVRESKGEGFYEIVAGERRWRAAQRAQLHQVPVIIKDFDDRTAFELAIIENIQREQLNAYEEGASYHRLIEDYSYTQDDIAKIVGKSRSHIANLIRLLNLPPAVHDWLATGQISMGHARALLASPDPSLQGREVVAKGLSVRQTEALVRKLAKPRLTRPGITGERVADADILALQRQLSDLLGLKIKIDHQGKSGSVTLAYSSLDQLDLICQRLSGERI